MKIKWQLRVLALTLLLLVFSGIGCTARRSTSAKSSPVSCSPEGLLLNLLSPGLGVDPQQLTFSWQVCGSQPSAAQTSYRLLLSSSRKLSAAEQGDVWDSGRVQSTSSVSVPYADPLLSNATIYYWRVKTWDDQEQESNFSPPQLLVTAPQAPWPAHWIGPAGSSNDTPFFLHKVFEVPDKVIERAIAFIALDGEGRLYLNEQLAGFTTGSAHYGNNCFYNVFDVTPLVRRGENCLALLGRGEGAILQALFLFADGSSTSLVSDVSWKARLATDIYLHSFSNRTGTCGGLGSNAVSHAYYEHINASNIPPNWLKPDFVGQGWLSAAAKPITRTLRPSPCAPLVEEIVKPLTLKSAGVGRYQADFGRELLGGLRIKAKGLPGDKLEIRLGEELTPDGSVMFAMRTGVTCQEWWTLSGREDTFEHLGHRAFRYAEVVAPPHILPPDIQARAVHVRFNDAASDFSCSANSINQMWALGKYTAKALTLNLWTDSEARERIAYAGDYYPAQRSYYVTAGEYTVPRFSLIYALHHPTWPTLYQGLLIVMFWRDYLYTGDRTAIENHYEEMKGLARAAEINNDGLVEQRDDLQADILDWPAAENGQPGEEDGLVKCRVGAGQNAVSYAALSHLALIAAALNKPGEAAAFREKAERLRRVMNQRLWDDRRGCYVDGIGTEHAAMHSTALAAAFGVPESRMRPQIIAFLRAKGQVGGVFGAQFYFDALYGLEAGDVAFHELTRTDTIRNWRHMIAIGATTSAEAWDPSLKPNMTWSHLWGNAIANIIAGGIIGIAPLAPGFAKIQIKPQPGGLANASLKIPSIRGNIEAAFDHDQVAGSFDLRIVIPANATAIVYLPDPGTIPSRLEWNAQPCDGKKTNGFIVVDNVGPGPHRFTRRP